MTYLHDDPALGLAAGGDVEEHAREGHLVLVLDLVEVVEGVEKDEEVRLVRSGRMKRITGKGTVAVAPSR